MARTVFSILLALVVGVGASRVGLAQSPVSATGSWALTTTGGFASGKIHFEQSGSTLTGSYENGRIDGKFNSGGHQADADWNDSRGTGWMTIIFSDDGNSFSGKWGYPARPPSGTFTGRRVAGVYPLVTGDYHVSTNGGPEFTPHQISLHQLSDTMVGNLGPGTQISGTITDGLFKGTWKGTQADGWLLLRFSPDSTQFSGDWGLTSDTQARGHITGSIVSHAQMWVRGLWEVASSSETLGSRTIELKQQGETVTGTFKNGHLQGTLAPGSLTMTGHFRDNLGTGVVTLKFTPDGKAFDGTWKRSSGAEGKLVGKRVIAASSSLRH